MLGAATASAAAAAVMMSVAACSSDEVALEPSAPDAADDAADASSPPEESPDATPAVDARPPFDAATEPVTCTANPCAVELVAGERHYCARMNDGTVRCWGDDFWGQLGRGEADETSSDGDAGAIPPVVGLTNAIQISAGGRSTCALLVDGAVQCWGSNLLGELGLEVDPPSEDVDRHPIPSPVALGGASVTRVDVGIDSACALLTTGKLVCWGGTQYMKLARPDFDDPFQVAIGPGEAELDASTFRKTFISSKTTLALTTTGDVFSWGAISGDDGLVSGRISSVSPSRTPKRLVELSKVTSVAVSPLLQRQPSDANQRPAPMPSYGHGCAIANGEVFCWGKSLYGALCTGLPDREPVPKRALVSGPAWPQQIAVGDETTCVRMTDGTVQCCGENTHGALGTGSADGFSASFTAASAFKGRAVQVAASLASICALVQGGTVECWGSNASGELGLTPDHGAHPTPTKITF
ncbi:MAG: hypothetical protein BGO98_02110 [Myxococcales bacterium 68-20]|nr:MAG: hypothetical protein BGO98_02110 [Myxococcales bacterium 68-20]